MFTADRMTAALNEFKGESPKGILEGVQKTVNEFVGDAPQFDDLTMLCIEIADDKK
jgi:sigma-B regulation protein RsbU (phosphoserine phosphatase)